MMSTQFRSRFNAKLNELMSKKDSPTFLLTKKRYQWIIERLHVLTTTVMKKKSNDYRLLNRYETVTVAETKEKKLQKVNTEFLYVCNEELFDVIHDIHTTTGHGARDVMNRVVKKKYANVTKQVLQLFADLCEECQSRKRKTKHAKKKRMRAVVMPRCQLDIVEVQMNFIAHFIMSYQDLQTKFTYLKVVDTTDARDVAAHLIQTFALYGGAPCILESYNGREFAKNVVRELRKAWPKCVLVYGKRSTTRIMDHNIMDMLNIWMIENNSSNWMDGLPFVQWENNNTVHPDTLMTPYFAMFSKNPTLGLSSFNIPNEVIADEKREEDIEEFIYPSGNVESRKEQVYVQVQLQLQGNDVRPQSTKTAEQSFLVHQLHNIPTDDSSTAGTATTGTGTGTDSDPSFRMTLSSGSQELSSDSLTSGKEDEGASDHYSNEEDMNLDIRPTKCQMSAGARDYLPPSSLLSPSSLRESNMDIIRNAWGLMLKERSSNNVVQRTSPERPSSTDGGGEERMDEGN